MLDEPVAGEVGQGPEPLLETELLTVQSDEIKDRQYGLVGRTA
jgi:hypothetical protein